ncbi:MAG: hypothetical protein LBU82_07720 [Treponema sp.]|jgi:hypothetical protein|nr:hypothetical protein [Treponema sp.]
MKTIICDVCKKKMEDPIVGRSYFYIAHRDLCEPCKDELELSLKPVIRTKDPFNYEWYDQLMQDSIEKAMQKGKF